MPGWNPVTERPLHVQVAEALSFQCWQLDDESWWTEAGNVVVPVPRYDTDWAATGPLIEKHNIAVTAFINQPLIFRPEENARAWWPGSDSVNDSTIDAFGRTALQAVCHLILALHKAGELTT
jgi:hypothetical protein